MAESHEDAAGSGAASAAAPPLMPRLAAPTSAPHVTAQPAASGVAAEATAAPTLPHAPSASAASHAPQLSAPVAVPAARPHSAPANAAPVAMLAARPDAAPADAAKPSVSAEVYEEIYRVLSTQGSRSRSDVNMPIKSLWKDWQALDEGTLEGALAVMYQGKQCIVMPTLLWPPLILIAALCLRRRVSRADTQSTSSGIYRAICSWLHDSGVFAAVSVGQAPFGAITPASATKVLQTVGVDLRLELFSLSDVWPTRWCATRSAPSLRGWRTRSRRSTRCPACWRRCSRRARRSRSCARAWTCERARRP